MRHWGGCVTWSLIFFAAAGHAAADTIRLKNGNVLEGEIEEQTPETITIEIPYLGSMTVSRADIATVEEGDLEATQFSPPPAPEAAAPSGDGSPQAPRASRPPCVADSATIDGIDAKLGSYYGSLVAYVGFRNKQGDLCATKGVLTIHKEVAEEETKTIYDTPTTSHEETHTVKKERSVKTLTFTPADFENLSERGGPYNGLAVRLSPADFKPGETAIIEWREFRVKKFAPAESA